MLSAIMTGIEKGDHDGSEEEGTCTENVEAHEVEACAEETENQFQSRQGSMTACGAVFDRAAHSSSLPSPARAGTSLM